MLRPFQRFLINSVRIAKVINYGYRKDYFAYFYHDTVRIYNAKSIIEVKKSECFVFNQIYSTNAFYFTIPTINQKESFHYQIKDINQNSEIIFAMSEKNSKEVTEIHREKPHCISGSDGDDQKA